MNKDKLDRIKKTTAKELIEAKSRYNYEIRIPKNATKEEIDEFMKKFKERWFSKEESSEPASKPDEASNQSSYTIY